MHILVIGRVQGVGFRYFMLDLANQCGLTGWVRNLIDGRVEALVCGSEDLLASYLVRVEKGSLTSEVDGMQVNEVDSLLEFSGFEVLATSEGEWRC